jgi:RNA polymerase-binding transcription factor DksA
MLNQSQLEVLKPRLRVLSKQKECSGQVTDKEALVTGKFSTPIDRVLVARLEQMRLYGMMAAHVLTRIEAGLFGRCACCGKNISKKRLETFFEDLVNQEKLSAVSAGLFCRADQLKIDRQDLKRFNHYYAPSYAVGQARRRAS